LFDHGHQVVRDGRRLRRLGMRVGRKDILAVAFREIEEHAPEPRSRLDHPEDHLALPHPVHRHVDVVARSGGMETARSLFARGVDDQPLDVEEEVLAGAVVLCPLEV
jgi:hypothetical protein